MSKPDQPKAANALGDLDDLRERMQSLKQRQSDYPQHLGLLSRTAVLVEKRMTERCTAALKPHGISYVMYQCLVLAYAACERPLTPTELARATGERSTNVTHICDELLRRELITRRPDETDRRRVVIELTAAGEQLLHRAQKPIWATWQQRYAGLDKASLGLLEASLETQLRNLDGGQVPRTPQ
ncbi:MarR family transcriptional regulator [Algiphilus sp. W345]|uniref:MarR family transcriptional regulator n=1 Tax=Banduia mediterranea TaxID=3075609 RepID=A0ABU2WHH3_9GAMM|nr:MarR family transcriptional regulator [Algiphilus sp. W345]MDT0496726.1 MarR family transcriptional regulator [Algiphilus sp. W345]